MKTRNVFQNLTVKTNIFAAAVLSMGICMIACEPLCQPKTFTMTVWDDEGNAKETKEVDSVKFIDSDGKEFSVGADVLNRGKTAFRTMCSSCHGKNGDGQGPSSAGLIPPPRNFTAPFNSLQFKFKSVKSADLPTDDDLIRTVQSGLHGTAMLQWNISEARLRDILQYIKTLSNRWTTEGPGKPIVMSPDPVAAGTMKREAAVAIGRWNFHSKTGPNCASCHPGYVTQGEYDQLLKDNGKEPDKLRENSAWPIPKDSPQFGVMITPPDFTFHDLRSVTKVDPASTAEEQSKQHAKRLTDLYRAIATGIGGTAMPVWKDSISEEQLWGLVYYVDSLVDIKADNAKRAEFMKKLRAK